MNTETITESLKKALHEENSSKRLQTVLNACKSITDILPFED